MQGGKFSFVQSYNVASLVLRTLFVLMLAAVRKSGADTCSTQFLSQSGLSSSGLMCPNPVVFTNATAYFFPSGYPNGTDQTWSGGVLDGNGTIWMAPTATDQIVKMVTATGAMTKMTAAASGLSLGTSSKFSGATYVANRKEVWMHPAGSNGFLIINTVTGSMEALTTFPTGTTLGDYAFYGSAFDGVDMLWPARCSCNKFLRINTTSRQITEHAGPSGFTSGGFDFRGGAHDGTNAWFAPLFANGIVRAVSSTGVMTLIPTGVSGLQLLGTAYDGSGLIFMAPTTSGAGHGVVRIAVATNAISVLTAWPSGFTLTMDKAFGGIIYDGAMMWLIPSTATVVIRLDPATSVMTLVTSIWPSGLVLGAKPFYGSVFDGQNIWLLASTANGNVKLGSSSPPRTYTAPTCCAAGTFSTSGNAPCTVCADGTYSNAGARSCMACPAGHTRSTGCSSTKYWDTNVKKNWTDAFALCASYNGTLPVLNNGCINDKFKRLFTTQRWLAGTRLAPYSNDTNQWQWVKSLTSREAFSGKEPNTCLPNTYCQWWTNEPDDPTGEQCLDINFLGYPNPNRSPGFWNSGWCPSVDTAVVCELPVCPS